MQSPPAAKAQRASLIVPRRGDQVICCECSRLDPDAEKASRHRGDRRTEAGEERKDIALTETVSHTHSTRDEFSSAATPFDTVGALKENSLGCREAPRMSAGYHERRAMQSAAISNPSRGYV